MEKVPEVTKKSNIENTENKKENKEIKDKIKIELAGKEYEIETTSYDFEYPGTIQKETGILGYKRTVVKEDGMLNAIHNYCKDFGINTEGCKDFNSVLKLINGILYEKKLEFGYRKYGQKYWEWGFKNEEGEKSYYNYLENTGLDKFSNNLDENLLIKKIDLVLSNGEFPNFTFNHSIGAHQDGKKEMITNFIKDQFFIQKLFSVDLTEKIKLGDRRFGDHEIMMDIINKKGNRSEGEINTHSLYQMKDKIKNNEIFLVGYDAFNTVAGNFWLKRNDNISFGFSPDDSFFKEYLKEIYMFCLKNNFNSGGERTTTLYIEEMAVLSDKNIFNEIKKYYEDPVYNKKDWDENHKEIANLSMEAIKKFLKIPNIEKIIIDKFGSLPYGSGEFVHRVMCNQKDHCEERDESEILIPIFINHDKIPHLSWGHAKYAHFFNQKGFNFFEFKHADHLPETNKE